MTVYGYTRVSTDEQATNTSLETQRSIIEGLAKANGLPDDKITWIEDVGVSGAKPFFERKGNARYVFHNGDTIIVASMDRFSRSLCDCLNTIEALKKVHCNLITFEHGNVSDETNHVGRLILNTLASFAEYEREMIKEKMAKGRAAKRARGGHIGGHPPWGFRVIGTGREAKLEPIFPRADEAQWRIKHLRAKGLTLRQVAAEIERMYNHPISHMAVKRVCDGNRGKAKHILRLSPHFSY